MFVNYQLGSGFNIEAAREGSSTAPMGEADFRLSPGSPALTGGNANFEPRFASYEVNGKSYLTPRPAAHFGAFGQGN
ncbi:hypothetical protein [Anditalea andensis]|uniref:Uncharacterized protein n=1 Tax=Anditalea andensis TaxID=1048983 RepID=A0A074L204_9BACT|nr:hypothetical protein [Anditalea andensis]KEO75179.1 hypothetical protein EL17_05785 [Anditalea andensis]